MILASIDSTTPLPKVKSIVRTIWMSNSQCPKNELILKPEILNNNLIQVSVNIIFSYMHRTSKYR